MDDLHVWVYHRPPLSLWQVKQAWLSYKGALYPVETMPSELFKNAIRSIIRDYGDTVQSILSQDDLDIIDRWYVLIHVTNGFYPLKLFYLKKGVFC